MGKKSITLTSSELAKRKKLGLPYRVHPRGEIFNHIRGKKRKPKIGERKKFGSMPRPPKKWETYQEYLSSRYWQWRRKVKLFKAGYACEKCGSKKRLEVHHKHYRSLGRESNRDLQALCRACHSSFHGGILEMQRHLESIAKQ